MKAITTKMARSTPVPRGARVSKRLFNRVSYEALRAEVEGSSDLQRHTGFVPMMVEGTFVKYPAPQLATTRWDVNSKCSRR